MQYDVFITADGASVDQLDAAAQRFRQVLEDGIGGPDQFLQCFRAYTNFKQHGAGALGPQEDVDAAAYMTGYEDARLAVRLALGQPVADIIVRLKS